MTLREAPFFRFFFFLRKSSSPRVFYRREKFTFIYGKRSGKYLKVILKNGPFLNTSCDVFKLGGESLCSLFKNLSSSN